MWLRRHESYSWLQKRFTPSVAAERMGRENILGHGAASNQVLLDNALEDRWRYGVVPRAIRIDHRDGSVLADAQAVGFRPVNAVFALSQTGFDQALFKIVPGSQAIFPRR